MALREVEEGGEREECGQGPSLNEGRHLVDKKTALLSPFAMLSGGG